MATISAPGVGSGLDIQGLIQQLMEVEREPLRQLEKQQQDYEAQLSAYGRLKSALSSFQSAMADLSSVADFRKYTTVSSDESVLTASASSAAAVGSYDIVVNTLAERHKLSSGAYADSDTTAVGTGTLTIDVGGNAFSVTIDASNNTLEGIAAAVNDAADNTGVMATVINDGTSAYLVFTASETGTANALTVTVTGDGDGNDTDNAGLSALTFVSGGTQNMTQIQAPVDASLTIDSTFNVTSGSNTVTGVISGVTLELEALGSATLDVQRDTEGVTESVQAFVDAYNALRNTLNDLGDDELEGDSTLRSIAGRLRGVLNTPPTGLSTSLTALSEVGITTERDGTLSLDTATLNDALASDFNGVAQLFANDPQGYAFRFEALADELLDVEGVIKAREDGLNERIDLTEERITRMEYRLDKIEQRYLAQFTALDTLLAQLQATGNFLSQQLGALG